MCRALCDGEETAVAIKGIRALTLSYPFREAVNRVGDQCGPPVDHHRISGKAEWKESGMVGFMGDHALRSFFGSWDA